MSSEIEKRIKKFLAFYERGIITQRSLSGMIGGLALDPCFFDHLEFIPKFALDGVKEMAQRPFAHPEEIVFLRTYNYVGDFDEKEHEAEDAEARLGAYWASRKLKEYFYPELPMPKFEEQKLMDVVKETILWEGELLVFGDFSEFIIRKNPIYLILPDGSKWVPKQFRLGRLMREMDKKSSDYLIRNNGQECLYLGNEITSPEKVPPGTEVWVDRSGVREIPPPPKLFE